MVVYRRCCSGATPGFTGIGNLPFLRDSYPDLGGFGGRPDSPGAFAVNERAKKP